MRSRSINLNQAIYSAGDSHKQIHRRQVTYLIHIHRASFAISALSKPQNMTEETQEVQAKFTRFRILVIGRANAGKTTILRRLCNTTGEAIIFSPNGEKVSKVKVNARYSRFYPCSQIESSTLNPTTRVSNSRTSIRLR